MLTGAHRCSPTCDPICPLTDTRSHLRVCARPRVRALLYLQSSPSGLGVRTARMHSQKSVAAMVAVAASIRPASAGAPPRAAVQSRSSANMSGPILWKCRVTSRLVETRRGQFFFSPLSSDHGKSRVRHHHPRRANRVLPARTRQLSGHHHQRRARCAQLVHFRMRRGRQAARRVRWASTGHGQGAVIVWLCSWQISVHRRE